jgi:DNA-binding MarR family transcriptional regulator
VTDLRRVFDDLVRFETILWNKIDARLQRECGVSLGNLNAMLVIESTPSCRVNDIARAVAITVGGASQAVDRLEAASLCARRPNPHDRRSSVVELTPAGQELVTSAGAPSVSLPPHLPPYAPRPPSRMDRAASAIVQTIPFPDEAARPGRGSATHPIVRTPESHNLTQWPQARLDPGVR